MASRSSSIQALFIGMSGTILQWYDFALLGYFMPIIAKTYFPSGDHFASLLSAFGIFAAGSFLQPLGAIYFGYIGDRYGRKRALSLSILIMAIPTALISLVPSYQMIGIAAPILITLLRMIQGSVAGSEFTGSAVFLVEHAKPNKKAFYGSLTSIAYSLGYIAAGFTSSLLTASFMPSWGWRLGFALSLLAGILIFYLRRHVVETPDYHQITAEQKPQKPFFTAVKEAPYAVFGVMGIASFVGLISVGLYVFMATFLNQYVHVPLSTATLIVTIALIVDVTLEPFIALWADKIGCLRVTRLGMIAILLFSVPIFYLFTTGNIMLVTLGVIMLSMLLALTYAPLNAYMVELFPPAYRYSGFGVSFHIGNALFSGTTPLVMIMFIHYTDSLVGPAFYYMIGAMIGLTSLFVCECGRRKSQRTSDFIGNLT